MDRREFLHIASCGTAAECISARTTFADPISSNRQDKRSMRTGVSCVCHHNPKHIQMDLEEMKALQVDDLLVAAQENDFQNFVGKIEYVPKMAKVLAIRPIIAMYGLLNLFGGSRMSQILLDHPEGFQVAKDGSHIPQGCYVNRVCVKRVKRMLDMAAVNGFQGYYLDEPTPQRHCYCQSCRDKFADVHGGDLTDAESQLVEEFRLQCLIGEEKGSRTYFAASSAEQANTS